jgi:CRP/FNR family transcriptional regulator
MNDYRLSLANSCSDCPLKGERDFCRLPKDALAFFDEMGHTSLFPGNAVLMVEGQIPRGISIICSGRAKVSMTARDGKTVIAKIASHRKVVGLSAVVTGRPSPVTVTTLGPCQIKFVEEKEFIESLKHPAAALNSGVELSREVQSTFDNVQGMIEARSSTGRLVRLLLSWTAEGAGNRELRLHPEYTHEEIAQMIGSSRETVTRLLGDLKKRELIRREGPALVIPDRIALQAIAS